MAAHDHESIGFTLDQLFKRKGGFFRHNAEGNWIRLSASVNGFTWEERIGLDLRGLRSVEDAVSRAIRAEDFCLERRTSASMGINASFYAKTFPNSTFREQISKMRDLINQQQKECSKLGFRMLGKELVRGSPSDYHEGVPLDVVDCPNALSKARFEPCLDDVKGRWEGLSFFIESEQAPEVSDLTLDTLIDNFILASYVDEKLPQEESWWDEVVREEMELTWKQQSGDLAENVEFFLKKFRAPLTSLPDKERESIYWGGGKPPLSKRKISTMAKKIFVPDEEMAISDFVEKVVFNLKNNWQLDDVYQEMGRPNLHRLAVGQMLKVKGQMRVNFKNNTVVYEPKPAAYMAKYKA